MYIIDEIYIPCISIYSFQFPDTISWTQLDMHGSIDTLYRTGHTAFCLPYCHGNKEHDKVYIYGGGDNNELFFNDIYQLIVPLQIEAKH